MGRSKTKSRILHKHLRTKADKYAHLEMKRMQARAELSEKRLLEQKIEEVKQKIKQEEQAGAAMKTEDDAPIPAPAKAAPKKKSLKKSVVKRLNAKKHQWW